MPIVITKDGIKQIASFKSYFGKDADEAIKQMKEERNLMTFTDCIGYNGHRNITLIGLEKRIEVICETDKADEVLNESLAPSEVEWLIIDIFEYVDRPKPGKGWYCKIE